MDIWRSLKLIKGQSLLFSVATIIAFVAILVGPSFAGQKLLVYKSSAKVLITPNSTSLPNTAGGASSMKTWFADEATLLTLLSSQDLLDVVIDSAGIKSTWTELRERIQLKILSNSGDQVSLLEISVIGLKPEEVRLLTLVLSEKFIQYVQQLSAAEHDKTVAFLERERRNTETEMARAQKRLLKIGIVPLSAGQQDPLEQAWVQLQGKRSELERDLALCEAELEELTVGTEQGIFLDGTGASTSILSESLNKARMEVATLRETFTDRSPQVRQATERLRRIEEIHAKDVQTGMSARLEAGRRKRDKIKALLRETESRLRALEARRPSPEKHLEYSNQERQLAMWQENYLSLTRQLYSARVMQQSSRREGAFTIVEKPQPGRLVSGQSGGNSIWTRILIAIPVSLICGLGVLLGFDYLNTSMQLAPRIEEALGLPVIGMIPSMPSELTQQWDVMKGEVGRDKSEMTLR